MAVGPRELIVCEGCHVPFEVSCRYARQLRAGEFRALCSNCRHPFMPMSDPERARYAKWWLDRFPLDDIREMGQALLPSRVPDALTAAAEDE